MKKVCLTIFLFAGILFAQSNVKISGVVLDDSTGLPLPGANIIVENSGIGAASDKDGRFEIYNLFVGNYSVTAKFIGYSPVTLKNVSVNYDETNHVIFRLKSRAISAEPITVTAERVVSVENHNILVFEQEEIKRSNKYNVAELLQDAGGVQVIKDAGDGSQKISVRGSNANQVVVMLDGVRMNDGLTGAIDLSAIPLSNVERIEINKGGSVFTHAEGALAGTIHIFTKKFVQNATVNGGMGSYGHQSLAPSFGGKLGFVNYLFTYDVSSANGDFDYSYKQSDGTEITKQQQNADLKQEQFFSRLSFDQSGHKIDVVGFLFQSERGLPGRIHQPSPYARAESDRKGVNLQYKYKRFKTGLSYSVFGNQNLNEYERSEVPFEYRSVPPYDLENNLEQLDFNSEYRSYKWNFALNAGRTNFWDKDYLASFSETVADAKRLNWGAGVLRQFEVPRTAFLPIFRINASFRYDNSVTKNLETSRSDDAWSPHVSIAASKKMVLNWQATAEWGKAFRLPTFADLFYQQYQVQGNANLLPEKSTNRQVSLSARWNGSFETLARFSAFDNDIENLIIWEMGSFSTFRPKNTNARLKGYELEFSTKTPLQFVQLNIFHTRLNTENLSGERTTHGKEIPYRPVKTTKAGLDINFSNYFCSYDSRWIGERYVTAANTVKMPGHVVHDVTLGTEINSLDLNWLLRLSVYNLTDENVQLIEDSPLPGREWRVGFQFSR